MFCRSRSSKIRRQKRRPFSMQVGRWSKVSSIKVSKISSATRLELGSAVSTACLAPPAAEPQLKIELLSQWKLKAESRKKITSSIARNFLFGS